MKWVEDKFGTDAVPWVFLWATIMVCVVGVITSIAFAVAGITVLLNVSIPAILVGLVGIPVTGLIMNGRDYV